MDGYISSDDMVTRQLEARGIRDPAVLAAMRTVPREAFVPRELVGHAHDDRPLPIGSDQTISQPYIVARMLEAAELGATTRVLDVGTGSGYAAAVAAELAQDVVSIERIPELADAAAGRLRALGRTAITVLVGDGTLGAPEYAPFDAIIAAAAAPDIPPAWVAQLAPHGRIVLPIESASGEQELIVASLGDDGVLSRRSLGPVLFVPLIGEAGLSRRRRESRRRRR
ncbi:MULTISPECIES: protein-L-isoaspartate(D-aspartate) O-methyltransferase [unclassified Leifsonia]|uniref:protein-L-isoaspartate(D-aspartate) O-methyltransferase n=1 Tax=unclassified Leifsonia TaxID=2663824 RepID=UPI000AF5864A|nr:MULTISPECIES: protein-L-isoaspartate(D-aspartate) O-methyltransferase [unclassified Leifsonia]